MAARRSLLVPLVTVVGAAWFALWACAPAATMPIPAMVGDNTNEFALGVNETVGSETYLGEFYGPGVGVSGQFWYLHRFGNFNFGGGLFAGQSTLVGGGVSFGGLFPVGAVEVGFRVSGGWLWADLGVPVTVPLGDHVWLYTEPSVGLRNRVLRLPIGAGFRLGKHVTLAPELAVGWSPQYALNPSLAPRDSARALPYSLGFTGALNVGYGF